ncbi:hypothetical protein SBA4_1560009 [Candidatus Sulfopaludibacter sp. SbA4]|nr:hypothetical protein SBA4_1560009 [Candidatus Sulfopaludibacter sp. SbA4]
MGRSFAQFRTPHSSEIRYFRAFRAIAATGSALFVGYKVHRKGQSEIIPQSPSEGRLIGLPRVLDQPLHRTVIEQ